VKGRPAAAALLCVALAAGGCGDAAAERCQQEPRVAALTLASPQASYLGLSGEQQAAVVEVRVARDGDPEPILCSGVLVSPRHALTGAHCLPSDASGVQVSIGSRRAAPDHRSDAEATLHPTLDLMVLQLQDPAPDALVEPLSVLDSLDEDRWRDALVQQAGFGGAQGDAAGRFWYAATTVASA
jgi:hypothetical protein